MSDQERAGIVGIPARVEAAEHTRTTGALLRRPTQDTWIRILWRAMLSSGHVWEDAAMALAIGMVLYAAVYVLFSIPD